MRATWSSPGGNTLQGPSNALQVQIGNTLKRALTNQRDALWMDHQQENVVSGGNASSIQFHYLLVPDTTAMGATSAAAGIFDANENVAGTADWQFAPRRDFKNTGRGF